MIIETFVGAKSAELASPTFLDDLNQSYRAALELDGVVFPDPEVQEARRLWDAQAKVDRGADALEADGSPVDLSGFDMEAAGNLLRENWEPILNDQRSTSLTSLGLLSKAATLMRLDIAGQTGDEHSLPALAVGALAGSYKQFVQLAMSTEEWGQAWTKVVGDDFEGASLSLPLPMGDIGAGLRLLDDPLFAQVKKDHFGTLPIFKSNIFRSLTISEVCRDVDEEQQKLVAQVGLFARHSPEGCNDLLDHLVDIGSLEGAIDWHEEMAEAVESASTCLHHP